MPWEPTVPFPAEDLSACRGCNAPIGWIRRQDEESGGTKAHPVDPKGWAGMPCGESTPGAKKGYTLDGDRAAVCEPPAMGLFATKDLDVVFTSHFATCPKRDRFYANARNRERQP